MAMNLRTKRTLWSGLGLLAILTTLFLPGLPWSARFRHSFKKVVTKAELKVAAWQGETPKLISLSGRVITKHGSKQSVEGAEIEALDSISGWASLTDQSGKFVLRDVIWYPKAPYTLIIKINSHETRQLHVSGPEKHPDNGIVQLGELAIDKGCKIDVTNTPGMNSVSQIKFDKENAKYYQDLFADLTNGKNTDEEKLDAINKYIANKFTSEETVEGYLSPRQIIENGSPSKGNLALAFVTLAEAGNYQARMLDLIDAASPPYIHLVTEVYYKEGWHLYDPVIGKSFRNQAHKVASYKDFRLDADCRQNLLNDPSQGLNPQLTNLYLSGFYHYYYLQKE